MAYFQVDWTNPTPSQCPLASQPPPATDEQTSALMLTHRFNVCKLISFIKRKWEQQRRKSIIKNRFSLLLLRSSVVIITSRLFELKLIGSKYDPQREVISLQNEMSVVINPFWIKMNTCMVMQSLSWSLVGLGEPVDCGVPSRVGLCTTNTHLQCGQ